MAYYRRRYRRPYRRSRKTYRRKRFTRYSRRTGRYRRRFNSVYHYSRNVETIGLATNPGTNQFNSATNFRINAVLAESEFNDLYDYYKINAVVITFKPDYNLIATSTGSTPTQLPQLMPEFHWAYDYDDDVPVTVNTLKEYGSYRHRTFNRPISIKIFPKVATLIYRGAVSTPGFGVPRKSQWINLTSNDVPHYGLKWCIDNYRLSNEQSVSFKVYIKYYFSMKGVR